MPALDQPYRVQGQVVKMGPRTVLRERTTHELLDLDSLFRSHYLEHYLTIQITDHGFHDPTGRPFQEGAD